MLSQRNILRDLVCSILLAFVGYLWLSKTNHPVKVDLIIEGALFTMLAGRGIIGYFNAGQNTDSRFKRFELFWGFTYGVVAIAAIISLTYLLNNPSVHEIGYSQVKESMLLQVSTIIKSTSFIFLFIAWFQFYRFLEIDVSTKRQVFVYLGGFLLYFIPSLVILKITGDSSILSLGILLGSVIGLFALIAQKPSTKFLTIYFFLFSCVHLWEFYLMGAGHNLITGLNNPVYWLLIMMYGLEVNRWIEENNNNSVSITG